MPCYNTATHRRLQRVSCCKCNYTAHSAKQCTELCSDISCDCTHTTAHDTRPTQTGIMPSAPRWSVCQRPDALHLYKIPPPRMDAVQVSATAYYNKVYKSAGVRLLWIHARRCNISQTMPARRGLDASHARRLAVWHRVICQGERSGTLHPAGQSSSGRRGTIGGYRRISFRAFAR